MKNINLTFYQQVHAILKALPAHLQQLQEKKDKDKEKEKDKDKETQKDGSDKDKANWTAHPTWTRYVKHMLSNYCGLMYFNQLGVEIAT